MSTDMASPDPTPASSGERSRTMGLVDEIDRKLIQINGICTAVRLARELHTDHKTIEGALWAAADLIEDAEKAFKELFETVIKGCNNPVKPNGW
jgi:hypothetical protein